jgi:superfamily II RNA helicase
MIERTPGRFDHSRPTPIRFLALSATVKNPQDVAEWLAHTYIHTYIHMTVGFINNRLNRAKYFDFGPEYRPVPLTFYTFGILLYI